MLRQSAVCSLTPTGCRNVVLDKRVWQFWVADHGAKFRNGFNRFHPDTDASSRPLKITMMWDLSHIRERDKTARVGVTLDLQ